MIFSELYSAYYNAVARILEAALEDVGEKTLKGKVLENAFSESVATIIPSLKSGKWQLTDENLKPVIRHAPTMPLTTLQKRWLKAVSLDKRIALFGAEFPELADVEPLFTSDDYKIYDAYTDGDPYESFEYIRHFRFFLAAIKEKLAVKVTMRNRNGRIVTARFVPIGFEFSEKDDKIRILAESAKYRFFNLSRILTAEPASGVYPSAKRHSDELRQLSVLIKDEKNALERAMIHFAHFEKEAKRAGDGEYILKLNYYASDESELVIRILSFGPALKVLSPESFVKLIKERLILQKNRGIF